MTSSRHILETAIALCKQEQFDEAIELFKPIWQQDTRAMSKFDLWNFARALKKSGDLEHALDVCRYTYKVEPSFKRNNDLYAWCIYELEIKGKQPEEAASEMQERFEKAANAIITLSKQDRYSPFEHAVMAYLRYLNRKTNVPFQQVLDLTDMLDPSVLNDESLVYVDSNDKQRELASYKEKWYAYRTKALEKTNRYEDCLLLAQEGIKLFPDSSDGNDVWFRWRLGKSLYHLGNVSVAITELENVLRIKKQWYIQHLLSQACFDTGDVDTAIQYAAEAALNSGDLKNKYRLFVHMARVLSVKGEQEVAKKHIEIALLAYAEQPSTRQPSILQEAVSSFGIVEMPSVPLYKAVDMLRPVWQELRLSKLPQDRGKIVKILPNGKAGFVKADNGDTHYFKLRSFQGQNEAVIDVRVSFYVQPSYDRKRQAESTEAVYVVPIEEV